MEKRKQKEKGVNFTREISSGGVVYKKTDFSSHYLWLVAKSNPSKLYPKSIWRLPKGWLDGKGSKPGPLAKGKKKASEDELQEAALREVREESGVQARIIKKLGTERYFFILAGKKIFKLVTFYLMEWLGDIPEGFGFETSEVAWLSFEKARERLTYLGEKKILAKAREVLNSGVQANLL